MLRLGIETQIGSGITGLSKGGQEFLKPRCMALCYLVAPDFQKMHIPLGVRDISPENMSH